MNGQSTVNHPTNTNEQLIGKFHVVNVDKLPINSIGNNDDLTTIAGQQQQQPPPVSSATDESGCASRFQMIRVDRNFVRGRWKVNDYEPPENLSISNNPPVNNIENETVNISNPSTLSTIPPTSATTATTLPSTTPLITPNDSNTTSSATLAATAASAAAAAATAFQQQQRLALNNPATVIPPTNVPPPAGLLHAYPPGTLPNMAAPNQSYILPNHHQFPYYAFYPPPYSPYAAQWAALAAAANSYLPPPPIPPHQQQTSQLPPGNLGEPLRHADTVPDLASENPVMSSVPFANSTTDHLQNAQLAATAGSPFIYAAHPAHSTFVSQAPSATASPYATIASYHPSAQPPTIVPPSAQPLSLAQLIPTNTTDIQQLLQSYQQLPMHQQAPILTSPKHDTSSTKNPPQQSTIAKTTTTAAPTNLTKSQTTTANGVNTETPRAATNPTQIADLLSSSPSVPNPQPPTSLLSPITVQTTNTNNINSPNKGPTASLNDIWSSYTTSGSPLNLSQAAAQAAAQTAAVTAVAAMGLLNNEGSQNTEIANEIFKELTTPTKQNNTTDIDNKISAAMDLVKMHLLSAVREEVTELRQQIRTLNEKVTNVEHENAFLRQHVSSEIYAQYTPLISTSSIANDSSNLPATTVTTTAATIPSSTVTSSQPIPTASLPSVPTSLPQLPSTLTTSQLPQPPASSTNFPPT